ncbi:MAG: Hsp70 family protein [Methanosphaera sp.]|nr:Hsp70 family protein [Methanosphaera sp.]
MLDQKQVNDTVDFAIDLGTSDSMIAYSQKEDIIIINNHQTGYNYTPSIIAMDKDNIIIGTEAKKILLKDPSNASSEFKLNMGFPIKFHFQKSKKEMLPEQLSAEIIKDLRKSAFNQIHQNVEHAVITVPANSNPLKTRATLKAAQLAGLRTAYLLQEPIAAAIAYGLETENITQKSWLIYDLGGGTFDASLVKANGEEIEKLATDGADNLGGKIFDWKIVDLFKEQIIEDTNLENFTRNNQEYNKIFAILKNEAEKAKKELNNKDEVTVRIENLFDNDYIFEYILKIDNLRQIMKPFIKNTFNICNNLLEEANIERSDIEKIILVGGSTLSRIIREMIREEYEIPLEYSINPLTVVARGAAIYASTISKPSTTPQPDKHALVLDYEKVSTKNSFILNGRIITSDDKFSYMGYTVQIENDSTNIKVHVDIDGTFKTEIKAESKINTYKIRVFDDRNILVNLDEKSPNTIKYMKSLKPGTIKLPESIRIGLENNNTKILAGKGEKLRYTSKITVYTNKTLKKDEENKITIPVFAGENNKTNNNTLLGLITINNYDIDNNLPIHSRIDIHTQIENLNQIEVTIFIPDTKQTLQNKFTYSPQLTSIKKLDERYNSTHNTIDYYKNNYRENDEIRHIITRIEKDEMMEYLEILMKLVKEDKTVINTTVEYINNINNYTEQIDEIMERKSLKQNIDKKIMKLNNIIQDFPEERSTLEKIIINYENAEEYDTEKLFQILEKLIELYIKLYQKDVITSVFFNLKYEGIYTENEEISEKLFEEASKYLSTHNYKELYNYIKQLYEIDERCSDEATSDVCNNY